MSWKEFVKRYRMVDITRLGVPNSTVAEWRSGKKEPKGWQKAAAEFWIEAKAGEKSGIGENPPAEKPPGD